MKKLLAILLAIITVFSFATVSVSAEETTETEKEFTGTLYEYVSTGVPRINGTTEGEVVIFQPGDRFQFDTVKAKTANIEVVYYPDVASIKATNIKNAAWSQKALDEKFAEMTVFAASPNKYKSFYTTTSFVKGDVVTVDILGLGDVTSTRDSAGKDRGEAAIDYELNGAKFIGWALYKHTWSNSNSTTKGSLEVYAVWDRTAGNDDSGEDDKNEGPVLNENDSPIKQALDTVLYYVDMVSGWLKLVPTALNTVFSLFTSTIQKWLYQMFGIVE